MRWVRRTTRRRNPWNRRYTSCFWATDVTTRPRSLAFTGGSEQEIGFLDWDASIETGPNGRKGRGILTAQELGGDADGRQEVCITLRVCGRSQPGTVTEADGRITFQPEEG